MKDYLPFIVVGVSAGSLYGLAGMGLVLAYKTSGIFNFAQGAIAGIIVAGVGNAVWLLTGRRAVGLRRRTVANAIERRYRGRAQPIAEQTTTLVAAKGMTRYHRADCVFVAERRVTANKRQTHESRGRTPCGVCRP